MYSLNSYYPQDKNVIHVAKCPSFKYSIAKAQLLLWRAFIFILFHFFLNWHYLLASGFCWFADCNQKQWALDGESELHSAVGFTHLMSKYSEALCLSQMVIQFSALVPFRQSPVCSQMPSPNLVSIFCTLHYVNMDINRSLGCQIWSWHFIPLIIMKVFIILTI